MDRIRLELLEWDAFLFFFWNGVTFLHVMQNSARRKIIPESVVFSGVYCLAMVPFCKMEYVWKLAIVLREQIKAKHHQWSTERHDERFPDMTLSENCVAKMILSHMHLLRCLKNGVEGAIKVYELAGHKNIDWGKQSRLDTLSGGHANSYGDERGCSGDAVLYDMIGEDYGEWMNSSIPVVVVMSSLLWVSSRRSGYKEKKKSF